MNRYSYMGGVLRKTIITLILVMTMSISAFADVTVTKEWEDGLTGTAASNRNAPTVNIEGSTSYEQLLNLIYPVGCYFITEDPSYNPNVAWGGTWQKVENGRFLQATTGGDAGTKVDAGLPNIEGTIKTAWGDASGGGIIMSGDKRSGAFSSYHDGTAFYYTNPTQSNATQHNNWIRFRASDSNSIYGKSTTVQPPAVKVNMWKRIA